MTWEIAFLLFVLVAMVYVFMTEILPVELTAFIGLLVLVFTGYVPVDDAFIGFSSPAVMTMFAIFFISGALLQTGVADLIGGRLNRLAGGREVPLIILVMLVAGVLSAFMNNVAAAAVLLPAIASLAREAKISPSRLFMPLSFGAILGGTMTLVGTPPNILANESLVERGLEPFGLFDFTPMGVALLAAGILFMTTIGRRLLPDRLPAKGEDGAIHLDQAYELEDHLISIRVPRDSKLDGQTLEETRLGTALDVQVVAVERAGKRRLAPSPHYVLHDDDLLLVDGRFDEVRELLRVQGVEVVEGQVDESLDKVTARVRGAVLRLSPGSGLEGRTLAELRFRDRYDLLVVGIRRDGELLRQNLGRKVLRSSDELLVLGSTERLQELPEQRGVKVDRTDLDPEELLGERLFHILIHEGSPLVDQTVASSRIGDLVGLTVVGLWREGRTHLMVDPGEEIMAGDELLVAGEPTRVRNLLDLGELQVEDEVPRKSLESQEVGVTEAVVAPRSNVAGQTPREIEFRGRYGLQILAVWRQGKPLDRGLADLRLRFGDALLLHGPWEKVRLLAQDSDFVVLEAPAPMRRTSKAPVALGALGLMIFLVASGLYPIHVAAFAGAVAAVLFGALKMDEAYRMIEWRALFLVAAVLPVGVAMETSGAAVFLAESVVRIAGPYGPYAFLAALAILASLLSQGLDGAPTVVILAPVVILTAERLGVSPRPLMMIVGLSASAAFMTPFSHKANLLVMGAGGYRAIDFVKVGTPLTIAVLVILVVLVPVFFPL